MNRILRYVLEGVIGSTLWSLFLLPYSILIERLSLIQLLWWLIMEYTIVLIIAPIIYRITKRTLKVLHID